MKKEYSETEIKIKTAAKSLFLEKGYRATTTRDISKESEINLALLNYYFTSKKKLFEIIMLETFYDFISKMVEVYNDEKSSLEEKLELTSSHAWLHAPRAIDWSDAQRCDDAARLHAFWQEFHVAQPAAPSLRDTRRSACPAGTRVGEAADRAARRGPRPLECGGSR